MVRTPMSKTWPMIGSRHRCRKERGREALPAMKRVLTGTVVWLPTRRRSSGRQALPLAFEIPYYTLGLSISREADEERQAARRGGHAMLHVRNRDVMEVRSVKGRV